MKDRKLPLLEHLEELRRRIIISLASVALFSLLSYLYVKKILGFLIQPVIQLTGRLIFIKPLEAFLAHLKLALLCGTFLALPVIFYQIWQFVSVGLKENERKYLRVFGPLSLFLFLLGAGIAYFLILPLGIRFLVSRYATQFLEPKISVSYYISFVGLLLLSFGCVFELPLVVLFLTKIGLVTPQGLRRKRKEVVLATFIFAAIMTPPDVFTQVLLALPILLLYEVSLWTSVFIHRRRISKEMG